MTWVSIRRERQSFRNELEQQASAILETLAVSSRGLLFRLDAEGLAGFARSLTANGYLLEVRFYDERGRLVASSSGTMATSEIDPLALVDLAREAVDHVAGGLGEDTIEVKIAPDLPQVHGDRVRLLEVFENLLENAIKYSCNARPQIEISGQRRGKETCICVADNGIGIDPSHQAKVFDLFTKLDPRTEGSGVGLAIVKRIIEVHGGRAWVESEGHGSGSRFWFSLPPPAAAAGAARAAARASG